MEKSTMVFIVVVLAMLIVMAYFIVQMDNALASAANAISHPFGL